MEKSAQSFMMCGFFMARAGKLLQYGLELRCGKISGFYLLNFAPAAYLRIIRGNQSVVNKSPFFLTFFPVKQRKVSLMEIQAWHLRS